MSRSNLVISTICILACLAFFRCSNQFALDPDQGGSETEASGTVLFASDSTAAAGAIIYLLRENPDGILELHPVDTADASGNYRFEFPMGLDSTQIILRMVAQTADSSEKSALVTVSAVNEQKVIAVPVTFLKPNGAIDGSIQSYLAYGKPPISVTLHFKGFALSVRQVDSAGNFAFPSLSPGLYDVLIAPESPLYLSMVKHAIEVLPDSTTRILINGLITAKDAYDSPSFLQDSAIVQTILDANGITASLQDIIKISENFRITELDLSFKGMKVLPKAVGQLTGLRAADFSDNQLSSVPDTLWQIPGLASLDLSNNILPSLAESIARCTSLVVFRCAGNALAALPDGIGALIHLSELDISANRIKTLPDTIGNLAVLVNLSLDYNLIDALPDAIGRLGNLQILTAGNNFLAAVPAAIGSCVNLTKLSLKGNQIVELPAALMHCARLEMLLISDNNIRKLPEDINRLTSLHFIIASNNQLDSLPQALCAMDQLTILNVDSNFLVALPAGIVSMTNLQQINVSSNFLCDVPDTTDAWLKSFDSLWQDYQKCATDPNQMITIMSPNGGERYTPGQTMSIRWSTRPGTAELLDAVQLYITIDGGITFIQIDETPVMVSSASWGNYPWVVPETIDGYSIFSHECFIKVLPYFTEGPSYVDISDSSFSIVPQDSMPPITLNSPNGGETYSVGDTMTISWETADSALIAVSCSLSVDSGATYFALTPGESIRQSDSQWENFAWVIPDSLYDAGRALTVSARSAACMLKVSDFIGCAYGPVCREDRTERVFAIE